MGWEERLARTLPYLPPRGFVRGLTWIGILLSLGRGAAT